MNKVTWLDWSKTTKQFSVNSHRKFFVSIRQAGAQPGVFLSQNLDTFQSFKLLF